MQIKVVSKGDYIVYKRQDGKLGLYKVLSVEQDFDGAIVTVQIVDNMGGLGRQKFSTSLFDKKGKLRIFRYWLQPGDEVLIKETGERGIVSTLFCDYRDKNDFDNMVEVLNDRQQQFTYNFNEVVTKVEIIDALILEQDDDHTYK